ncbi:hypothetical protein QR680_003356 [Steinernema hermaphroditum]|uniref:Uncharacterized protein n=1 Tax=Steinernema hermaphroditum TaxID=289476 RepID=A0AA39LK72_9BILA|nr:hypothetical protein QR680_003356 [Steinernema hermaphroditum]
MGKRRRPLTSTAVPTVQRLPVMFKKPVVKLTAEEERRQRLAETRKHYNQVSQSKLPRKPEELKTSTKPTILKPLSRLSSAAPMQSKSASRLSTFNKQAHQRTLGKSTSFLTSRESRNQVEEEMFVPAPKAFERLRANPMTPGSDRHHSLLPKELMNVKLDGDYVAMFKEINSARKLAAQTKIKESQKQTPERNLVFELSTVERRLSSILKSSNRVRNNHVRFAPTIEEEPSSSQNSSVDRSSQKIQDCEVVEERSSDATDTIAEAVKTLSINEEELSKVIKNLSKDTFLRLQKVINNVANTIELPTLQEDDKENGKPPAVKKPVELDTPKRGSQPVISPANLFADREVTEINKCPKERFYELDRPSNPIAKAIGPYTTATQFCPIKSPLYPHTPDANKN